MKEVSVLSSRGLNFFFVCVYNGNAPRISDDLLLSILIYFIHYW